MKNIGLTLKNARENKDYTQKRVMELTGINRKSLSGYENNVAEPDLNTFARIPCPTRSLVQISRHPISFIHFSPFFYCIFPDFLLE